MNEEISVNTELPVNEKLSAAKDFTSLVAGMSLEEKASLCSGQDYWHTKPVSRLSIPSVMVADGPHGLRRQISERSGEGIGESRQSTCFPAACAVSCSFDRDLLYEMGQALGRECLDQEVSVILGPGVNIKRSPLCGRNFEYYSEDPFAAGEMASALISGIQSQNIGTSLKHFAANSQEKARMVCDSIIDERALREIYLTGFEIAVKSAEPWTLMASYNLVNGTYASENRKLLTDILRSEWGFKGIVMSDWGAVNIREAALAAGLDLEMPPAGGLNDKRIVDAVRNKILPEEILDASVTGLLEMISKTVRNMRPRAEPYTENNRLAEKIALESSVLLKNNGLLPAKKTQKAALIGAFAKEPRYQGSGSSKINPTKVTSALDAFLDKGIDFAYADGYPLKGGRTDSHLLEKAIEAARDKDVVFIFAGLPDEYESEGFDRTHMDLPESHNRLISEVVKVNPNVAVVLFGGAPFLMPWLSSVRSVLMCYLPGQAAGGAVFDLLYGNASPCGKLAETFPVSLSDNPSYPYFGASKTAEFRESIFVGYRYYDAANKPVLFPFGFGLSYSSFEYKNLALSKTDILDSETVTLTMDVENKGSYDAKETVQIYIRPPVSKIFKAKQELKGFSKISLKKGETGSISVTLDKRSFAYYNTNIRDWHVETGSYTILAGASSRDIRMSEVIHVTSTCGAADIPDYHLNAPEYYSLDSKNPVIPRQQFASVYGGQIPSTIPPHKGNYHLNSTLSDLNSSLIGRIFTRQIHRRFEAQYAQEARDDQRRMMEAMFADMPLRALVNFSGGELRFEAIDGLLLMMNGHLFTGLAAYFKGRR